LHDDEIAKLWRAFIPYSHYDGVTQWPYPASDAASAIERLKRINGRPSFICHEGTVEKTREFIAASGVQAPFTFQAVPFRNHNDEWVLRPSPARAALREWLRGVLDAPGLVSVRRLAENPIICPAMLPGKDGDNINGPSLIRVPAWLPNSLGKYYLYFANHHGKYIRLAYANRLEGPWKIFPGGVLNLKEAPGATGHIASPDVHIDNERHELRLYFHGPAKAGKGQMTFYSSSKDGKHFTADATPLCPFYLRAFRWDGMWYGLAKSGQLYRSPDGRVPFTSGGNPLPGGRDSDSKTAVYPRHVAVDLRGDTLWVYWSNIGDAPEHILCGRLRLTGDWTTWKVTDVRSLLRPEQPWEGASLPVKKSSSGAASRAVHQLRDPVVFVDDDGRSYLLYSVAGESGVAIAELLLYSTTKP
jgi:hypothetical protein